MKLKKPTFWAVFVLFLGIVSVLYIPYFNKATYHGLISFSLDKSVPFIYNNEIDTQNDVILDTRTFEEYSESHIPNAIWVGENNATIPNLEKNTKIIVYCSIGKRSETVGKQFIENGYQNVYNLYGGIFEWHNDGLTTLNENNDTVFTVHPYSWFWGLWIR